MLSGDDVASAVLRTYCRLQSKGKPLVRSNGVVEGTVLAGIVIASRDSGHYECVSLATGVKALPDSLLSESYGLKLHDMHAEILAIRGFNRYLVDLGLSDAQLDNYNHEIYMYVSAIPCGDASMSLLPDNGETWKPVPEGAQWIRGRNHYDAKGYIRTKPGRQDSNLTMSKSCTDKLTLRQKRGLILSPLLAAGWSQVYLTALVCDQDQIRVCQKDLTRAFSRWNPTHPFIVMGTSQVFNDAIIEGKAASPTSLVWVKGHSQEAIVNGVRAGSKDKPSIISRKLLVQAIPEAIPEAIREATREPHHFKDYLELKSSVSRYHPAGWVRTQPDNFILN